MNSKAKSPAAALTVEQWPLERLVPYARNPRKNDEETIAKMVGAIREFGFRIPVCARSDGLIIDGHLRYSAAQRLGLATIPVALADELTDEQIKAFRLLANRSATWAEWDSELLRLELGELKLGGFNLELTGFGELELGDILAERNEGLTDPDDVPPVPEHPVSQTGDLWLLGRHRLLCGDSTKSDVIHSALDNTLADCIFTSPPYAVGVAYDDYVDDIDNLRTLLPLCADLWKKCVMPGGFAVVNFGDVLSGQKINATSEPCEYPMAIEYFPVFRKEGWTLWSRRVWCKPGAAAGSSRHCINSNRAASNYEHVWTWKLPGTALIRKQISGPFQSQAGWFDTSRDPQPDIRRWQHGAVMVTAVAQRAIEVHSRATGLVLEPFAGAGTTMIAAEVSGRRCASVEVTPAYVDVAVKRWQDFTGNAATLDGDGRTFDEIAAEREAKAAAA